MKQNLELLVVKDTEQDAEEVLPPLGYEELAPRLEDLEQDGEGSCAHLGEQHQMRNAAIFINLKGQINIEPSCSLIFNKE